MHEGPAGPSSWAWSRRDHAAHLSGGVLGAQRLLSRRLTTSLPPSAPAAAPPTVPSVLPNTALPTTPPATAPTPVPTWALVGLDAQPVRPMTDAAVSARMVLIMSFTSCGCEAGSAGSALGASLGPCNHSMQRMHAAL